MAGSPVSRDVPCIVTHQGYNFVTVYREHMTVNSPTALLDKVLCTVPRRYRLSALSVGPVHSHTSNPSTALAHVIERARQAMVSGDNADAQLKRSFVQTLAQMINDALRADKGDPAFQAMLLQQHEVLVREYVSLLAHANHDRRTVLGRVNAIAHPGKQQPALPHWQRDAMAHLYAASSVSWSDLVDTARRIQALPQMERSPAFQDGVLRMLNSPEIQRLQRLEALTSTDVVRRYLSLSDKQGPRSGSRAAVAQGAQSQQRGAAVEALATRAIQMLAQLLNEAVDAGQENDRDDTKRLTYRVVTSMRVPAQLANGTDYAKTEWDVVLLRQTTTAKTMPVSTTPVWDVCLFVEAKASPDAATTDFPRLLRGLELLAQADENNVYSFQTREGTVQVSGTSLRALDTDMTNVRRTVLYCCDAPADASSRLLSAANRARLLGEPASLEFARMLMQKQNPHPDSLEPLWHQLLESPRWHAVLHQYPMLQCVRELMIYPEDIVETINTMAT